MNYIRYFFRGTPEGYIFPTGSIEHWLIIAIILFGIGLIIRDRDKFRILKYKNIFKFSMIIMLAMQQIILYLWYWFSGYFTIQESLPLYNCRVAIIFTIFAFITNKDFYKNICCYWGIVGAILALTLPVVDPFKYPYYTIVSFFLGHTLMLWSAFYFLVVEKHYMDKKGLISMLLFTNAYHMVIYIFDKITHSNYCYLIEPPFAIEFVDNFTQYLYTFIAFNVFNISIMLFYFVCRIFYIHHLKKEEVKDLV